MNYSHAEIISPINTLKKHFMSDINSSWFKRFKLWFFPSTVKKILDEIEGDQMSIDSRKVQMLHDALRNKTWFFQRWLFSCLNYFFSTGLGFTLNKIAPILITPVYFDIIASHSKPSIISSVLDSLLTSGLLTPENQEAVLELSLGKLNCFHTLQLRGMLTQENFEMVKTFDRPWIIIAGFIALTRAGMYSATNKAALLACENPENVASAINTLSDIGTISWLNPMSWVYELLRLKASIYSDLIHPYVKSHLLNHENFNAIINHQNIPAIYHVIHAFQYATFRKNTFTQTVLDKVLAHSNPMNIAYALKAFDINLSSPQIEFLFQHADILLTNTAGQLWARIPLYSLKSTFFVALHPICEDTTIALAIRRRNFANHINRTILGITQGGRPLNDAQSTHTASVHASVSESASKLLERYGSKIVGKDLENICNDINYHFSRLSDDNAQYTAAKRCIQRITAPNYTFIDPESQVSIKQLLALTWLAITDEKARCGTFEDAKTQFIVGLYEIQRGYNLSAENVDDQEEDKSICLAGTFNKLIEKLASIHPCCTIVNLSKGLAALKLPKVINEEAKRYLKKYINRQSPESQLAFTNLVTQIKNEGAIVIWDDIRNTVLERMFEEFGSLYQNNKEDKSFVDFIECGKESDALLIDIPIFLQKLPSVSSAQSLDRPRFFSLSTSNQTQDTSHEKSLGLGIE